MKKRSDYTVVDLDISIIEPAIINRAVFNDPPRVLTFKNKKELIKTLCSLPEDMVQLVGYVNENGDIQALKSKDLKK